MTIMESIILTVLGAILALIGLAGMLLPVIPGAPILFAGLLLAAWADQFAYVGTGTLVLLGGLTVLTYLVDLLAGSFGVKRFGASPRAMIGAAVGTVLGLFFGLFGVIVGPFIGASIGELTTSRNLGTAGRAGLGATLGLALGAAAKLALAFTMLGIFAVARFT
jgi:uncharacterized protein YqgC (DUF456 family)